MGVLATVGGVPIPLQHYSVNEASTPTTPDDTTGSVGDIAITLPSGSEPHRWHTRRGQELRLYDSHRGNTVGTLLGFDVTEDTGLLTTTAPSRMAVLNLYDVQADPFVGSFTGLLEYYFSLAGVTDNFTIDESFDEIPVAVPGWFGELWLNLKIVMSIHGAEITLIDGKIIVRPVRQITALQDRDISRSTAGSNSPSARRVEVNHYATEAIVDQLVYPPGGWNSDVPVLTVKAGETTSFPLDIEASLMSVQQPVIQESVAPDFASDSVFTVSGDDGLPISPEQWSEKGGTLWVDIDEDTLGLTLNVTAPKGLPKSSGGEISTYSLGMSSDANPSYSTLRIVGTGVRYLSTTYEFPTDAPANQTQQDVGVTVDTPLLNDLNEVYRIGATLAARYSGTMLTLSGSVTTVNERGDNGVARALSVDEVEAEYGDLTIDEAEAEEPFLDATVDELDEHWLDLARERQVNQTIGNVAGARVWDEASRRFYRVRTSSTLLEAISIEAEEDLNLNDLEDAYGHLTVDEADALNGDTTVTEADLAGLPLW